MSMYGSLAEQLERRKQEQSERDAALKASKKQSLSQKVGQLNIGLSKDLDDIDGIRVYINRTQVNVDFDTGDKVFLTSSNVHDRVRFLLVVRHTTDDHYEEIHKLLKDSLGGFYSGCDNATVSENSKQVQLQFMVTQEDLSNVIKRIYERFLPNVKRNLLN